MAYPVLKGRSTEFSQDSLAVFSSLPSARMRSEGCFVCLSAVCLSVVCVCVYLSVTALAATAFVSACNERHLRHYYGLFLDSSSWIFEKTKVMA